MKRELIKKKAAFCEECNELIPFEEFIPTQVFRLSDFREVADLRTELIDIKDLDQYNGGTSLDGYKCGLCDSLSDDLYEEGEYWFADDTGEFFKTKKEAQE